MNRSMIVKGTWQWAHVLACVVLTTMLGCGSEHGSSTPPTTSNAPPAPSSSIKHYDGVGTITKVDFVIGSVELDHEEIKGLMPAMRMEFYVKDRALLTGIAVGDRVDFTIEHNVDRETLSAIKKR